VTMRDVSVQAVRDLSEQILWRADRRSPWRWGAAPLATVLVTLIASTAASAAGGGAAPRWSARVVPQPPGAISSDLNAVSCVSSTWCVAVGEFHNRANQTVRLALNWDGRRWARFAVPGPSGASATDLFGVRCRSTHWCVAVGSYELSHGTRTLVERWNGSRWFVQRSADQPGAELNSLDDVSCSSERQCTAVGWSGPSDGPSIALAERWDGSRWRIQTVPSAGIDDTLFAVSCPAVARCAAVGVSNDGDTLTQAWDGVRWKVVPELSALSEESSGMGSISCTSSSACTAVGGTGNSAGNYQLIERWNGTRWSAQSVDSDPGTLYGVSCPATTACTAVGTYFGDSLLATSWDGRRWSSQELPLKPHEYGALLSVSCTSRAHCMAVGSATTKRDRAISMLLEPGTARPPSIGLG
jgi:hypothetical protein